MTLSLATESAFNRAIEAAYKVQEIGHVYGLESEQNRQANEDLRLLMGKYWALISSERWWEKRCQQDPACLECKCFDL